MEPTHTCGYCGIEYIPKKVSERNKFCSRACKDKNRIGDGRSSLATRKWIMFNKYGVTYERYQELKDAQGGGCAICRTTTPVGRQAKQRESFWLHVDHCHDTGRVRGLLCMECNTMIGKAKHDPVILRAAIAYLQGS